MKRHPSRNGPDSFGSALTDRSTSLNSRAASCHCCALGPKVSTMCIICVYMYIIYVYMYRHIYIYTCSARVSLCKTSCHGVSNAFLLLPRICALLYAVNACLYACVYFSVHERTHTHTYVCIYIHIKFTLSCIYLSVIYIYIFFHIFVALYLCLQIVRLHPYQWLCRGGAWVCSSQDSNLEARAGLCSGLCTS